MLSRGQAWSHRRMDMRTGGRTDGRMDDNTTPALGTRGKNEISDKMQIKKNIMYH